MSEPEFCPCPQCFNCTHFSEQTGLSLDADCGNSGICACEKTEKLAELTSKLSQFKTNVLAAAAKAEKQNSSHRLVHTVRGDIARATGHRYAALERETENLSHQALTDLRRLIGNMKNQTTSERNKRRRGQFW